MKRNNRKGFTTVELVIVIAVIAILAAVLIPTFANLISKANDSAALQEASNVYKNYMIENATAAQTGTVYIRVEKGTNSYYYFAATNGQLNDDYETDAPTGENVVIIEHSTADEGYAVVGDEAPAVGSTTPTEGTSNTEGN